MRRPGRRVARRGVSLVEVLATLVLVGIVLPAAMAGVTLSLRAASLARHQQEAGQLAEMRLNEILALADSAALTGTGDFSPDFPDYQWQAQVFTADYGLSEVMITVTWLERGQERSVSLSTLVYDMPTIAPDSGEEETP